MRNTENPSLRTRAAVLASALMTLVIGVSCAMGVDGRGARLLLDRGWESYPGLLDEAGIAASKISAPACAAILSPFFRAAPSPGPVTYHIRVRVPAGSRTCALYLPGARSFRELLIDGQVLSPGANESWLTSSMLRFPVSNGEVSIIVQSDAGGPRLEDPGLVPRTVLFGDASGVESFHLVSASLGVLLTGYFFLGGLFLFLLFLFWRKNRDFLALALFMAASGLYSAARMGGWYGLLEAPRDVASAFVIAGAALQALALVHLAAKVFPGKLPRAVLWAGYAVPVVFLSAATAEAFLGGLAGGAPPRLENLLRLTAAACYALFALAFMAWLSILVSRGSRPARWFLPAFTAAVATVVLCRLFPSSVAAALFLEPAGTTVFVFVAMLMLVKKVGDSFESAEALTDYVANVSSTMKRFIPAEFLEILDKADVVDLRLGDHVKKEMTIFFSDIRSFTELSEHLTVEENFNFINSYLSRMVPIVTDNDGFVDKYIGDGIMALFPGEGGPDKAIGAAIAMQSKMVEYNGHRAKMGYRPLSMGVGVHTGDLMLGVIGVDSRMENTVISDAVNLCSRLQAITKAFNISLAISEQAFKELEDPGRYKYRFIGKVKVKGKSAPVSVFEIYDGIAPDLFERKMKANTYFEQGMLSYYQKDFGGAMYYFKRVLEIIPEDGASAFYLDNCINKATI